MFEQYGEASDLTLGITERGSIEVFQHEGGQFEETRHPTGHLERGLILHRSFKIKL